MVKVSVDGELETFTPISGDILIELPSLGPNATPYDYDTRVATIVCVSDGRVVARLSMDAINLFRLGQAITDMSQKIARGMSPEAFHDYVVELFAYMEQQVV